MAQPTTEEQPGKAAVLPTAGRRAWNNMGTPKIYQYLPLGISEQGRGTCRKSRVPSLQLSAVLDNLIITEMLLQLVTAPPARP